MQLGLLDVSRSSTRTDNIGAQLSRKMNPHILEVARETLLNGVTTVESDALSGKEIRIAVIVKPDEPHGDHPASALMVDGNRGGGCQSCRCPECEQLEET